MRILQTAFELRSGQGFVTDRQTTDATGKNNISPLRGVGDIMHENLPIKLILRLLYLRNHHNNTIYSRTSMARTLMARLPRLFQNRS